MSRGVVIQVDPDIARARVAPDGNHTHRVGPRAITSRRGILAPGSAVTAADFARSAEPEMVVGTRVVPARPADDGIATLATLMERGYLVATPPSRKSRR